MRSIKQQNGAALVEYVVLMAFLSLVVTIGVLSLSDILQKIYGEHAGEMGEVVTQMNEANPASCTTITPAIGTLSPDGTGTLWESCAETYDSSAVSDDEDDEEGDTDLDTGDMTEDAGSGWCPPSDWEYAVGEDWFRVPGSVTPQPVLSYKAYDGGTVTVEVNSSDSLGPDYYTEISAPFYTDMYWWGDYYGVTLVIWHTWKYTGEIKKDDLYTPDPSCL
jgi:Flp pilus assembly pilin Flp